MVNTRQSQRFHPEPNSLQQQFHHLTQEEEEESDHPHDSTQHISNHHQPIKHNGEDGSVAASLQRNTVNPEHEVVQRATFRDLQEKMNLVLQQVNDRGAKAVATLVQKTELPFTVEKEGETLCAYLKRFNNEALLIDEADDKELFERFMPLNTTPERILVHLINDPELQWRRAMKPGVPRDQSKYYRFHWDHGHDTSDCIKLKMQIEALIQCGRLQHFLQGRAAPAPDRLSGGESGSSHRAYARRLRSFETMAIDKPSKAGQMGEQPVSFSE
ncbi:hypothetical protein RHSIM_Rhsim10G0110500 [Rhododendron simsii]|uniref:Retrotransposon gag domain-containing protein n=1 Tax=Rhododendron simsii TaxID=118357 RepID=A0A834G9A6_RHOSS|nr:hypothetical protein RHSIM_Rhsim10G0110500 [Rhododendron simsii]